MDNILKSIQQNEKVAIYGAGVYASILYTYLKIIALDNKIQCILVTDGSDNITTFYGKPIEQISGYKSKLKDYIVIIAIKDSVGKSVHNNLSNIEIKKIYQITKGDLDEIAKRIFEEFNKSTISRNKVFLECFAGMGYCCNCKYIAEALKKTNPSIEIVWAVTNKDNDMPNYVKQVKRFSCEYFKELYTAGVYIGNDAQSQYIHKRKEQYYINTWHGSGPFKKVFASLFQGNLEKQKEIEKRFSIVDVFISNTGDNTEMFRDSFCYNGEILECGSPRNDIFFTENNIREKICEQLGIDNSKKIVLYAPTFRDGDTRSFESYDLDMTCVLHALEQRFGGEFILLYRFHHRLHKFEKSRNFYPDAVNVTLYPDMQELLVVADVLITDYSSTMWDFSLQDRPIFLYHNDKTEYENDRGFYCPVKDWPYIKAHSTEEMVKAIENFDEKKYFEDVHAFIEKYGSFDDGHASEQVVKRIMDVINRPEKYGKE